MASISKLSVRGVRAFSPDDEEQVISFYSPLTVIVGNNGCGKTTIIEALRYAVAGTLPPGTRSGQAFVHDPKSAGQSNVKANIKLRFSNRAGNSMVVVRSMELIQKKTNMQFKALDGILRTNDPSTGERVALSHKCTELDRQIPNMMGVSKPILEHVVFTHQEDSSWPLQDAASLKKKFDDIFDSTRYAKALEAIRKSRLEYAGIAKDHKADLAGLASHKHAAEGFRQEMDSARDELAEIDDKIASCDEDIDREREQRAKYEKVLNEMQELSDRAGDLRNEVDRDMTVAASKRSMLEEDWTETQSAERLEAMLSGFDDVIRGDVRRRDEAEAKSSAIEDDIERLRGRVVSLNSRRGKLEAEAEAHDAVVRGRFKLVDDIASRYDLTEVAALSQRSAARLTGTQGTTASQGPIGTQQSAVSALTGTTPGRPSLGSGTVLSQDETAGLTAEDMEMVKRSIDAKERELKEELVDHRRASQREEDALQEGLGELQAKMRGVESDRQRNASRRSEAQNELSRINSQVGTGRMRKSEIDEAKRQAAQYAKQRDELNREPRKSVIPREIKAAEEKIDALRRAIEEDASVLRDLRQGADNQAAIDMLRHQITQDAENVEEALRENSFLLTKHDLSPSTRGFGSDADGVDRIVEEMKSLVDKARDKHGEKGHDLSRVEEEVHSAQKGVSEKGALVDQNRRNLNRLRSRVEDLSTPGRGVAKIKKMIRTVRNYENNTGLVPSDDVELRQDMKPEDLLNYLSERSREFNSAAITPESVRGVLKKLKQLAREKDDDGEVAGLICPCCRREMDEDVTQDFANAIKELSDPESSEIILASQSDSAREIAAKKNYDNWHAIVQGAMTDYLEHQRATEEIEVLERTVTEGQEALDRFRSDLESARSRASDLREEVSELRSIVDISSRLRDDSERMFDKKTQMSTKEEELSIAAPSSNGRDLGTVEREIQARTDEKDSLMQSITRLNRELTNINDRISRVTTQAAKTERLAKEKEERYKAEQEASVKKTDLNEVIARCQQEEKKLAEQIVPIKQKIRAKESDRQRMRSSAKADEDRLAEALNHFKADVRKLDDLSDKIDRYLNSNKPQQFEEVTRELSDTADEQDKKEKELDKMKPELASLNKKVNDQERHKKTIQGNIELLGLMEGIDKKRKELDLLEEEIDAVQGSDTTGRDYEAAGLRIQKHENTKAKCEGRRAGMKDQIRSLKRKLQTQEYKDIDERHRRKMIEFETTLIAVSDLEKYHTALDKALLRYHGMKIADINKIIRELWTLTYKGEDITNIKLTSDQDKGSKASRSHNYRVVMTKGNTELDMRGRCSAGQRVLASLVIRMALAETFCLNCGVMCLDEPTTNLDYANKRGLALALAQIIANRASQTNFQLVVITHDEDFVTIMKNELSAHTGFSMPERYFQVSREEGSDGKHYSKIHAIDWDEL